MLDGLEKLFEGVWFRCPRFLKPALHRIASDLSEALCGFSDNTTCTQKACSDAIALYEMLDVDKARQERHLPPNIHFALAFNEREWDGIVSWAHFQMDQLEQELDQPQWQHLKRRSTQAAEPCHTD